MLKSPRISVYWGVEEYMTTIPDPLYLNIIRNIPIPCVDICVVHEGRILLVKRGDKPARGSWWLPGGRVHKGEKMAYTAKRKALEEVGLDCVVGPLVHTAETIFPDGPWGISVHSINSCFLLYPKLGESTGLNVTLDSHHEDYRWVDAIDRSLHPYVKDCLRACGLAGAEQEETDVSDKGT